MVGCVVGERATLSEGVCSGFSCMTGCLPCLYTSLLVLTLRPKEFNSINTWSCHDARPPGRASAQPDGNYPDIESVMKHSDVQRGIGPISHSKILKVIANRSAIIGHTQVMHSGIIPDRAPATAPPAGRQRRGSAEGCRGPSASRGARPLTWRGGRGAERNSASHQDTERNPGLAISSCEYPAEPMCSR